MSTIAPTLQIEIPYALRVAGLLIGLLMIVWPVSVYIFGLISRGGDPKDEIRESTIHAAFKGR